MNHSAKTNIRKSLWFVLAFLGWATLIVRLYLRITESNVSAFEAIIQFFSFFTILTNLLVTLYCTQQILALKKEPSSNKPEPLTALTVFILIVGIVYHIALKPIWNPEGLQWLLSEIHHTIVPLGTFFLWTILPNKNTIQLQKLLLWLAYPLVYITFVLIRGNFTNFYPYPFLNVSEIGLSAVFKNSVVLLLVMTILLGVFFIISKKLRKG